MGTFAAALGPGPSRAQTTANLAPVGSTWVTDHFSQHRYFWVDRFDTCLSVWIRGDFKAERVTTLNGDYVYHYLRKPRIRDVAMDVWLKKSCDDNAGYKSPANQFSHRIMFYANKCSLHPSFTVGIPWSFSMTVTPDCDSKKSANNKVTEKGVGNQHHLQYDLVGLAAKWDKRTGAVSSGTVRICTSLATWFRLKDTKGHRKTADVNKAFKDPCVRS